MGISDGMSEIFSNSCNTIGVSVDKQWLAFTVTIPVAAATEEGRQRRPRWSSGIVKRRPLTRPERDQIFHYSQVVPGIFGIRTFLDPVILLQILHLLDILADSWYL